MSKDGARELSKSYVRFSKELLQRHKNAKTATLKHVYLYMHEVTLEEADYWKNTGIPYAHRKGSSNES